uniref:Uncharacterized protein n=1 Tax=Coccidioides posadasii RMSCC 3488 TaxID=454284 RepID=A0A0J6FI89_COCPO|nr:hypothetical protein CPAG_06345 [Coccidioides posadasii RMSCC 3488]
MDILFLKRANRKNDDCLGALKDAQALSIPLLEQKHHIKAKTTGERMPPHPYLQLEFLWNPMAYKSGRLNTVKLTSSLGIEFPSGGLGGNENNYVHPPLVWNWMISMYYSTFA